MSRPYLVVRDLAIRHPGLDLKVSFSAERGELVSVLGPSGSGKTTTLRLISGFERPEGGVVLVDGEDVTGLPPEKRRIGIVFQDFALFPHLDVARNVAFAPAVRRMDAAERAGVVERWLDLVGLAGFQSREVRNLSGGEQQRVAIARSLASGPRLLLLDEPFSSIDAVLRRDLRGSLMALQKDLGMTMIFVTHSQEEALAISDRVVVLNQGRIAQVGTPDDLYLRPASRFVAGFVGEATFRPGIDGAGRPVTRCVRPDRMRFAQPSAPNAFEARVLTRQYFGHYHAHTCHIPGAAPPDDIAVIYGSERHEVGERVHLAFATEDSHLLPDP